MKKLFLVTMLFAIAAVAGAQEYKFPLDDVKALEINMNYGQLYVRSAVDDKYFSVTVYPQKSGSLEKKIILNDGKLRADFDDVQIDKNTVITVKAPLKAELKIKSVQAEVSVSNMAGFLSIEASSGTVKADNFKGKLEIVTAQAEVSARGIFDSLKIETAKGDVRIKIDELPQEYKYEISGAGNVFVDPGRKIKKNRKLVFEKNAAFTGKFEIKQR